jgi:dethiobiotin synthetase
VSAGPAAGTPGIFVGGTGTEVGKSVVAAVIAAEARAAARRVGVFKPAVSGTDDGGELDHELLRRASGSEQTDDEIAPHRFGPAVSPHLAAELAGAQIDPGGLITAAVAAGRDADLLVCEGVGGMLVPLTPDYLLTDLAIALGLPLVIVAPPALGTINHSLLTLEAVRARGLEVRAVVLNPWPAAPSRMELSNLETISRLGRVEVLTLGPIDIADPASWPRLGLA